VVCGCGTQGVDNHCCEACDDDHDGGKACDSSYTRDTGEACCASRYDNDCSKACDTIDERRTCRESRGNATGSWRRSGVGLGEYREQCIPLPGLNLLRQDQGGLLHD